MPEYEDEYPSPAQTIESAYRERAQQPACASELRGNDVRGGGAQFEQSLGAATRGKGGIGMSLNVAPGAQRRPLIDAALDDHDTALEELWQKIQLLEQRLSSVLAPVGPETGTSQSQMAAPRAPLPPLAERLADMTRGLSAARSKIQELVGRLEV